MRYARSKRRLAGGYTAVEVMIAMTLFAIGAAGVVSMQRATLVGNAEARRMDGAVAISRLWVERLRRDSMAWTAPNSTVTATNRDLTQWMTTGLLSEGATAPTAWTSPGGGTLVEGGSAGFDVLGREVAASSTDLIYCVNYRLQWIGTQNSLMRAEVRVVWSRMQGVTDRVSTYCTAPTTALDPLKFHIVTMTTLLRRNAAP